MTLAFLKKEYMDVLKTHKVIIIFAIFLFFGFLSPITAKYINEILLMAGGFEGLSLPEPTYYDSFAQFFKNTNSICILVIIFSYMGCVINEKKSGTIVLMLSKGLSRRVFILAKFLSAGSFFTIAYFISAIVSVLYTYILFGKFDASYVWLAIVIYWFFGIFIIALTIFSSTISNNIANSAFISVGGFMILSLISTFRPIAKFIPNSINRLTLELITGLSHFQDITVPLVSSILLTIILITVSIFIFEKQEL